MGGMVLEPAAPQGRTPLLRQLFIHFRIAGACRTVSDVVKYSDSQLSEYFDNGHSVGCVQLQGESKMEEKERPEKPVGRKKRWIIIAICVVIVILCVPMIQTYKDGGTVCYDAILYDVTDYNRELSKVERVNNTTLRYTHGMKKGVEIRILGFTV